jgi:Collagen triple helix repeat (20 copies)
MRSLTTRIRWSAVGATAALLLGGCGMLQASASTSSNAGASMLVPVVPQRVFDTRGATGPVHPLAAGETYTLSLASYLPLESTAISANITVTDGSTASFLTIFPTGKQLPKSSNINWKDKSAVANQMTLTVGDDRSINLFNSVGRVDVIIDLQGYYIPASASGTGPAGPAGPAGVAGPAGAAGATGAVGPVGAHGADGAVGPSGAVGPAGAPGTPGSAGATGAAGAVGPSGAAGSNGVNGLVGPAGPVGPIGATGPVGPVGPVGANGPIGAIGLPGVAGTDGAPGASGPQGLAGPAGIAGPAGANGLARLGRATLFAPTDDIAVDDSNFPNPSSASTALNLGVATVPNGYYLASMSTVHNVDGHADMSCWLSDGTDENGGLYPGTLPTIIMVEPDHQELVRYALNPTVIHVTNNVVQIRCSRAADVDLATTVLITAAELNLIPFAAVVTPDNL